MNISTFNGFERLEEKNLSGQRGVGRQKSRIDAVAELRVKDEEGVMTRSRSKTVKRTIAESRPKINFSKKALRKLPPIVVRG